MTSIRSGKGLGDNLYLQSIVRHLVGLGRASLEVCTPYPDLFLPLAGKVRLSPFRRDHIDLTAHYISRKHVAGTDQFVDCCLSAGLRGGKVDLKLDWLPMNTGLIDRVMESGRPVVLIGLPRMPMGREDGYGMELLPDCATIQRAIDLVRRDCFVVQIGQGRPLHQFERIDLDLANATTVTDLLDVASVASVFVGYCSFMAPLAESFARPGLFIWSKRGLASPNPFIRAITPAKILHRASSRFVMDDCSDRELAEAVDEVLAEIRRPALV